MVRNPYFKTCPTAQDAYRASVSPALKALDLPNAINYLDAAHGGFFGWNSARTEYDMKDIANELTATWKQAGGQALKQFRGLAVNVKSYNAWDMSPGETFVDENSVCADLFNKCRNEQRYIMWLSRALEAINSSIPYHTIMDSTRNRVQGIRYYWHDWCNNLWAGFGPVPGVAVSQAVYAKDKNFDTFVWATPAGFSDGTSDHASPNWKANCSSEIAYKPMPEKGVWSQAYFESLLSNTGWSAALALESAHVQDDFGVESKLVRRCDGK